LNFCEAASRCEAHDVAGLAYD